MTPPEVNDLKVPTSLADASRRLRLGQSAPREPKAPKVPKVPRTPRRPAGLVTSAEFFATLRWLDGRPLPEVIEPYRRRIFDAALDEWDGRRLRYNLILTGRAKKNWKSADLVLASLYALLANDSPGGNQCYLLANDADQAGDDLTIAKKVIAANPALGSLVVVRQARIERVDGDGYLEILPAGDVAGSHGKTYRFCGWDEIHSYRSWDIMEAMSPDPTRTDAQQWITSYASIFHRPGAPLFDLMQQGKAGKDPRFLFAWYAADGVFGDEEHAATAATPEEKANPSMGGPTWDPGYLAQQAARLPAHRYRRLHLNLPGLPEGAAYTAESVMQAVARGVTSREPERGIRYLAFVDMSGGSSDDATLAIAHEDPQVKGRAVVDLVMSQGRPAPFDPHQAVVRFCPVLDRYGVRTVSGDDYAGNTFKADFDAHGGIMFHKVDLTKSEIYESCEAPLNSRSIVLLDQPLVEQQLLGLGWRGGRIDHPAGEHDDWANAAMGAAWLVLRRKESFEPLAWSVTTSYGRAQQAGGPSGAAALPGGLSDARHAALHQDPTCSQCRAYAQRSPARPPERKIGRVDLPFVHPHERE